MTDETLTELFELIDDRTRMIQYLAKRIGAAEKVNQAILNAIGPTLHKEHYEKLKQAIYEVNIAAVHDDDQIAAYVDSLPEDS